MAADHPIFDAYLLRTWQEPAAISAPPTCYYLLEEIFGTRQRWLFTDPALFYAHLQRIMTPTSPTAANIQSSAEA